MDDQLFDDFTRVLGSTETRRRVMKVLGSGGLAVLLARLDLGASEAACRNAKKRCKRDKQCCSGRCKKGRCKGNGAPIDEFCLTQAPGTECGDGCFCLSTTSGARRCGGEFAAVGCFVDADCESVSGPGAFCFFNKDGERQCVGACPNPN